MKGRRPSRPAAAAPRAPVPRTSAVPRIALYGTTDQPPAWADLVHFEWIPERSSRFAWEIDPHVHDALIQVLYLTRGGGEAFIDGVTWRLEPPCLIVAPARSVHGFRFSDAVDGPVVTAAQRPLESLAAVAAPALLATIRRPAVLAVAPDSRPAEALLPLFEAIEREARAQPGGPAVAGLALLLALFIQVARVTDLGAPAGAASARAVASGDAAAGDSPTGGRGSGGAASGGAPGGDAPADDAATAQARASRSRKAHQIERFRTLVDARFRQRLPVEGYAAELGISGGQLTRLCHEMLGQSSRQVIDARVLHEAQRELIYSSLTIKQIAGELGFDDEAYFGRFFRKQTGYRPTDFRRIARDRLAE